MADDADELRRLEQQVRTTIKARMGLEQHLANAAALQSATARAFRDRDAVTSPALEEARGKVADDIDAFHARWRELDRIARDVDRLSELIDEAPAHVRGHRDAITAGLPDVRETRARIARIVAAAGLEGILPEGAPADGQR